MIRQRSIYQLVSLVWMLILVACAAPATPIPTTIPTTATSTSVPPTATKTRNPPTSTSTSLPPTSTESLPAATSEPQMTVVNTLPGIEVADAYMSQDYLFAILGSGERPSSTIFPSGTEQLYTILVLCPAPTSLKLSVTITGPNGNVDLDPIVGASTVEYPAGCISIDQDAKPKSGKFPDGAYKTTINVNGTDVVMLGWAVGTP